MVASQAQQKMNTSNSALSQSELRIPTQQNTSHNQGISPRDHFLYEEPEPEDGDSNNDEQLM